jgi:ligand-binding sensor domain-containing protein
MLWTGDTKGILHLWDTDTLDMLREINTDAKSIMAILRIDDDTMWVGTMLRIEVRNAKSGELLHQIPYPAFNLCHVDQTVWVGDAGKVQVFSIAVCAQNACMHDSLPPADCCYCHVLIGILYTPVALS